MTRVLPWLTALWVLVELLSLRIGILNALFFDTRHADVQGIDYFSVPEAWLNLRAGRSLYATFDSPAYGPHVTWFLAHPALTLLGWPLSALAPMDSYGVFTLLSLGAMALSAFVLTRTSADLLHRRLIWLLLLGAFPTYLMLWVGNVQAFTVLGLSVLFAGMAYGIERRPQALWLVRAGLLLCLLTKPVVLLMLPLLLLMGETRRAVLDVLAVYVPVSLLFLVVPVLNPEGVGLRRVAWLAIHPAYVRATMDVYANGLRLTPDMRDNSVHWFNLLAQSGHRLQHVDVYSLPVFLDGLLGVITPGWLYLLPTLLVLVLSVAVARMPDGCVRREAALLLVLAASLDFFLAYPTVWEYQYTAVLPVGATLLVQEPSSRVLSTTSRAWGLALSAFVWLPSLYFLSGSATPSARELTLVRLDRVLPVLVLFCVLCWCVGRVALFARRDFGE